MFIIYYVIPDLSPHMKKITRFFKRKNSYLESMGSPVELEPSRPSIEKEYKSGLKKKGEDPLA